MKICYSVPRISIKLFQYRHIESLETLISRHLMVKKLTSLSNVQPIWRTGVVDMIEYLS